MASTIVDGSQKRDGSASVSSSNGMPVLNETYNYLVQSDDKLASRLSILYGTAGLPRVGQTVSAFGYAVCKGVDATRRADNPYYWDVSCTFSSEVEEGQDTQNPESDPTVWIPIYETKFERLQDHLQYDVNGKKYVNSAGQRFTTGLLYARSIPVWEFFQFEPATVSDFTILDRDGTLNDAEFKECAEKTLLLSILSSKIGFYYGQRRRLTHYSLKYNSFTWIKKILDTGSVYIENGQYKSYLPGDERHVMVGSLNGSGGKVPIGDPPALLDFQVNRAISFSFLRI